MYTCKTPSSVSATELENTISNLFSICKLPSLLFIMEMKCETTLRDLEITRVLLRGTIKKRAA